MDKKTVEKIAKLSALKLGDGQIEGLLKEFDKILDHFSSLAEVNTEGIEPLINPSGESVVYRNDQALEVDHDHVSKALEQAPEALGNLFKVPPVV